ncbi:MAG TPA: heat-inducible transcriptional repressor HrcA [Gammaproteobacteria bacterium]|nr:heat-inducible transcriptional repressor HrcA [Gammaproteobacteria bacterium]
MSNHKPNDIPSLNERARKLLKTLVHSHINEGQPIGSRALAKSSGLDVSPATIRNVMADLEDMGLISSPHTSAGRIPTSAGYRVFVDTMLQIRPLNEGVVISLEQELGNAADSTSLVKSASELLSSITSMAGVVTLPKTDASVLQQIDFVKLDENRVLAVLVLSHGEVQNRVLTLDKKYSRSELQQASNYLTEEYAGCDLVVARDRLVKELRRIQNDMNSLMESAVTLGGQALAEDTSQDYVMAGETSLMDYQDLADLKQLRQLFDSFGAKRDILHILDRCTNAEGVQIFIGQESGNKTFDECSVVTAPYSVDGAIVGVMGVIGPTRMDYDKVVPVVDVTARLLGAALNSR